MPPYGRQAYTGVLGQNTVWARLFLAVLNVLLRAQLAFDFVCGYSLGGYFLGGHSLSLSNSLNCSVTVNLV